MTEEPVYYGSEEPKNARLDRLLADLEELNERQIVEE